jgi:hypothetical protein
VFSMRINILFGAGVLLGVAAIQMPINAEEI